MKELNEDQKKVWIDLVAHKSKFYCTRLPPFDKNVGPKDLGLNLHREWREYLIVEEIGSDEVAGHTLLMYKFYLKPDVPRWAKISILSKCGMDLTQAMEAIR